VEPGRQGFFGWRVVGAAFTVAVFGWGIGFYGPPVFLHAIESGRGWPVPVVSAAVTCHFLLGAFVVTRLAGLHRRFGIVAVTRAGAVATALGLLGWGYATSPWQLFPAATLSGAGWAATGAAAINAMVSPWFVRRRPVALGAAYNGASVGGIVFSPLWVALIAGVGFGAAAAITGAATVAALWWLSARYLGRTPAAMGQEPDGDTPGAATPARRGAAPIAGAIRRDRRFATLATAHALCLFAQIGLIAHLVSLLAAVLGAQGAGLAAGMATACALIGRTATGWVLRPGVDRRVALAINTAMQAVGVLVLWTAGADAAWLLLGVAIFGLGIGNATSLPPLIAQQDFAESDVPRVVGLVVATGQAAYAFAPAAFGLLREMDAAALFVAAIACQALCILLILRGRAALRIAPPG